MHADPSLRLVQSPVTVRDRDSRVNSFIAIPLDTQQTQQVQIYLFIYLFICLISGGGAS